MNIIYIRISTDEERQDPEQQLNAILDKFKLKEYRTLKDIGSAYKLDKIHKREHFLEILDICFNANTTTIKDLFLANYTKKKVNLYVWDYSRIIRNIEFNVLFNILAYKFDIKIHSYKDKGLFRDVDFGTPSERMVKMLMNTITAYSSEQYSYDISTNIKKSYSKGYSTYGKKWGKGYRSVNGEHISMTAKEDEQFKRYVKHKLKHKLRSEVIEIVKKEKGIVITPSWLSRNF